MAYEIKKVTEELMLGKASRFPVLKLEVGEYFELDESESRAVRSFIGNSKQMLSGKKYSVKKIFGTNRYVCLRIL